MRTASAGVDMCPTAHMACSLSTVRTDLRVQLIPIVLQGWGKG